MSRSEENPIANAKAFLDCSKLCQEAAPNVAYVLATTALEEVGKALLKKQHLIEKHTQAPVPSWVAKHSDDHQKKLFWAIWTPMLGNQVITGKDMEESRDLAISIHQNRLKAQYSDEGNNPKLAVTKDEVQILIKFTEARIGLEESYKPSFEPDRVEKMNWFLNLREEREDANLIFGRPSMEKLSELKDAYKWICWLKEQFDNADAEARKLAKKELGREIELSSESKIKWKMTVKIVSRSHSIRQGEFVDWNKGIDFIKLRAGDSKKRELYIDFSMSDKFLAKTLWWQSQALINHFLVALNVGTFGYFWWFMPTMTDKFYEKLIDLENNSEVRIESHPEKPINWGNLALKKEDLNRVSLVMPFIVRCKNHKIFDHYLTGLGFLSKSDCIMRFEHNAFEAFAKALQLVLQDFHNVSLETFLESPAAAIGDLCKDWGQDDVNRLKELVSWAFSNKKQIPKIEPDDVAKVKVVTDYLLFNLSKKFAEEHFRKIKNEKDT